MLDREDLERLAQVGSRLSLGSLASELEMIHSVFDDLQGALDAQLVGMMLLAPFEGLYYTADQLPTQETQSKLEHHLLTILESLQFGDDDLPTTFRHQIVPGRKNWEQLNLTTFIGLPLMVEGRMAGLLFATRSLEQPRFSASDLTVLAMLCGQLSVTWLVLHLNRQLSEQNRQLQALNKYREEFIRNLSHDLRTPLTCILGYAELLHQHSNRLKVEQQEEFLGQIVSKSKTLRILVDNLLDFNDSQDRKPLLLQTVDITECLEQAAYDIRPLLTEKNQRLTLLIPTKLPPVQGEGLLLTRVLLNLLHNSQKFSPINSELFLEATRYDDWVRVSVRDHGPGLPPEALERVFEKFRREEARPIQSSAEGIGLGLTICKDIVEACKGRIWAENWEKGTAFCFELRTAS